MLSFVLVALLCCVIFIFRFISRTVVCVLLNYIYYFVLLNTLWHVCFHFCARTCVCVVLDCLPDFGAHIRYKQRLYPS